MPAKIYSDEIYLHPTGSRASSQFSPTPAGAGTNWDRANDQSSNAGTGAPSAPDNGTSYVSGTTDNERDSYALQDNVLASNITVSSIVVQLRGGSASGEANFQISYKRVGIDADYVNGGTIQVPDVPWAIYSSTWTGLNWGLTDLNALEIGTIRTTGFPDDFKVSPIWVKVNYTTTVPTSNKTFFLLMD